MLENRTGRVAATLGVVALLAACAMAAAGSAAATTLYACANKKTGVAHVYAKKHKCKKNERQLSFNTRGVPGAQGATGLTGATGAMGATGVHGTNGFDGAAGINGAAEGFSSELTGGHVNLTSTDESSPATVLTRTLPAGSFIIASSVELLFTETMAGAAAEAFCTLTDTPTGEGAKAESGGAFGAALDLPFAGFVAIGDVPDEVAVSSPGHSSTITLACYLGSTSIPSGTFHAEATAANLVAVQTASNS